MRKTLCNEAYLYHRRQKIVGRIKRREDALKYSAETITRINKPGNYSSKNRAGRRQFEVEKQQFE